MKSLSTFGLLSFAAALTLSAGPVPDTIATGVTGGKQNITTSSSGNQTIGAINGLNGGRFSGTLAGSPTDFWCVDSQLQFNPGQSGQAYVVLLKDIPTAISNNPNYVRYGSIVNEGAGAGQWNNPLDAGLQTVQQRYAMAAWLINDYKPTATTLTNSNANKARQAAIWSILSNDGTDPFATYAATVTETATKYINLAKANYSTQVDLTKWAVVTWDVDNSPALRQTFLVQVVPEPGFYGVLRWG